MKTGSCTPTPSPAYHISALPVLTLTLQQLLYTHLPLFPLKEDVPNSLRLSWVYPRHEDISIGKTGVSKIDGGHLTINICQLDRFHKVALCPWVELPSHIMASNRRGIVERSVRFNTWEEADEFVSVRQGGVVVCHSIRTVVSVADVCDVRVQLVVEPFDIFRFGIVTGKDAEVEWDIVFPVKMVSVFFQVFDGAVQGQDVEDDVVLCEAEV